jgi:hypothetical protein
MLIGATHNDRCALVQLQCGTAPACEAASELVAELRRTGANTWENLRGSRLQSAFLFDVGPP